MFVATEAYFAALIASKTRPSPFSPVLSSPAFSDDVVLRCVDGDDYYDEAGDWYDDDDDDDDDDAVDRPRRPDDRTSSSRGQDGQFVHRCRSCTLTSPSLFHRTFKNLFSPQMYFNI